jgi:subtilisin family serine protease
MRVYYLRKGANMRLKSHIVNCSRRFLRLFSVAVIIPASIFSFTGNSAASESYENEIVKDVQFAKFHSEKALNEFIKETPEAVRLHPSLMWVELEKSYSLKAGLWQKLTRYGITSLLDNRILYKTPVSAGEGAVWGKRLSQPEMDPELWGMHNINIGTAWAVTKGKKEIIVAISDTGIDRDHGALSSNIWANEKELNGKNRKDDDGNGYKDDKYGVDFIGDSEDTMDGGLTGHGSHVAGTVGGIQAEDGFYGVAPNITLMAVKTHNARGNGTRRSVSKGLLYAADNGASVVNCSWGGAPEATEYDEVLYDVIEYLNTKGVVLVASAGNNEVDIGKGPHYPASYDLPNIISVGALNKFGELASFSNWGKKSVDIAAPGTEIYSAQANSAWFTWKHGTSMAAPHIAGAVALIKSTEKGSTMSPEEIKQLLIDNAVDIVPWEERGNRDFVSNKTLDLSFLGDGSWD